MFAAKQVECRNCGHSFIKSNQGGNSSGLFCTKKCAGQYRSRSKATRLKNLLKSVLAAIDQHTIKVVASLRAERKNIEARFAKAIAQECAECLDCGEPLEVIDCKYWKVPKRCARCRRKRGRKPGSKKHTTRARKKSLPRSYSIAIETVGDRDGWVCQLCGNAIQDRQSRTGPLSPCIDHIVPINHARNTKHGHTVDNVQIAHRLCNERKGCSIADESLLYCESPRLHLASKHIIQSVDVEPLTGVGPPTKSTFVPESHATPTRVSVGFPKNREA